MQKISISGPAELLAVLPFHLGFRPTRSAVLVCFEERRMGLVARLDICPRSDALDVAAQVLPALRAEAPTHVMLVGYEEEPGESAALCDALDGVLVDEGVEVSDRLVVRGDRWYGLLCGCCPDEGTPLSAAADVPGVAGFVALGRAALPDRESLAALVQPAAAPPGRLGDAIREFVDELEWARRLVTRPPGSSFVPPGQLAGGDSELRRLAGEAFSGWGRLLRGELATPFDAELPALVGCLRDAHLRDALIAWLCPGTLSPDELDDVLVEALEEHLGPIDEATSRRQGRRLGGPAECSSSEEAIGARLEGLCRVVPEEHATPVLAVVASYAWWCGDGARASVALEKALDLEPDHRLCALLRRLVSLGIRTQRASA